MSKIKTTDWFDGAKFVPYHVGIYEVINGTKFTSYQYWNGSNWGARASTTLQCYGDRNWRSDFQSPQWRGIKK